MPYRGSLAGDGVELGGGLGQRLAQRVARKWETGIMAIIHLDLHPR